MTQVAEFSKHIAQFREVFVIEGPGSVDSDLDKGKGGVIECLIIKKVLATKLVSKFLRENF